MDAKLKILATQHQVLSEADERKNSLFLEQIREWLHLENVDAELRDHVLKRLGSIFEELAKSNSFIKRMMDIDAQLAA